MLRGQAFQRIQDNLPGFTQDGKSAEFPGLAVQEIDLFGLLRFTAGEDLVDMAALAGAVPVMKDPVALGPAPPGLFRHHAGLVPVGHNDVEVPVDDDEHIWNGAEDVTQNGVGGRRGACRGRAVRRLCCRAFPGLPRRAQGGDGLGDFPESGRQPKPGGLGQRPNLVPERLKPSFQLIEKPVA